MLAPGRKLHWVSLSFGSIIRGSVIKALDIYFSREAKERNVPVVGAFYSCLLFCVWQWFLTWGRVVNHFGVVESR